MHIFCILFPYKCSFNTLQNDQVSILDLLSLTRYQTIFIFKLLFSQLMTLWTLRFIFDHLLRQWPTGGKRANKLNTKLWISWEEKKLFRWNKKHFSYNFLRNIIYWKKKKKTQALMLHHNPLKTENIHQHNSNLLQWCYSTTYNSFARSS